MRELADVSRPDAFLLLETEMKRRRIPQLARGRRRGRTRTKGTNAVASGWRRFAAVCSPLVVVELYTGYRVPSTEYPIPSTR